jgi:aerobic-type carbon monoxide dehydrogenase small subunit (CoxS/CutS family)
VTDGRRLDFRLNGAHVSVDDVGASLLEVLREQLGVRSVKDGCSPQGQCGCCTVLVDGSPRVACVTPSRRIAGRDVTTVEGLGPAAAKWGEAFARTGASQCGFCTPGIVVRFDALRSRTPEASDDAVERALLAHLCRCTGWRTIVDAWHDFDASPAAPRDLDAAARRAALEGGCPQRVGVDVALGGGGFADDTAPADALVAVLDAAGEWVVAESLVDARRAAAKVQGRRTTAAFEHPIALPEGEWAASLQTSWVEPAYLETDASWCLPGGEPATALANGGAFGGKITSCAPAIARELADRHQRAVRVVLSREDTVRLGAKRPPLAAGMRADGSGSVRVARTPGIADAIRSYAPDMIVEEVDLVGPPTSAAIRAAGWAEMAVLAAGRAGHERTGVVAPNGAAASASLSASGTIDVTVECGAALDATVLRSYCIGAAHMAASWVTSEHIAVDGEGEPHDLTIRSFGVLRAVDTPPIDVTIVDSDRDPVNGSDAVFAAVAGAVWVAQGCAPTLPTGVSLRGEPT